MLQVFVTACPDDRPRSMLRAEVLRASAPSDSLVYGPVRLRVADREAGRHLKRRGRAIRPGNAQHMRDLPLLLKEPHTEQRPDSRRLWMERPKRRLLVYRATLCNALRLNHRPARMCNEPKYGESLG